MNNKPHDMWPRSKSGTPPAETESPQTVTGRGLLPPRMEQRYALVAHYGDGRREEIGCLHETDAGANDEAGYWARVLRCQVRVGKVEVEAEATTDE